MSRLESLVCDIGERFGLGNKAAAFVAEILHYMFDANPGGLQGFIDRFTHAGLGDVAASWLAQREDNLPVTEPQLESAIGSGLVQRLGTELSLAGSAVRTALVYAIPKLVDKLTPEGIVPDKIPADVQSFLNSPAARFRPTPANVDLPKRRDSRGIGTWGWAAALLGLGVLAYWGFHGREEAQTPVVVVVQPEASLPARLALSNTNGKLEYSGVISDEKTRTRILGQLQAVFGTSNLSGQLDVDPRIATAQWLPHLGALLKELELPGTDVLLEGTAIRVGGSLSQVDRSQLLSSIKDSFGPDFSISPSGDKVDNAVKSASDKTLAALDALKPGYGGADLVNALNQWVINFAPNSAQIPADGRPLIARAADAIKKAPHDLAFEVAGHTDDTGNAATNKAISKARAVAVREALVASGVPAARLTAKGYGSAQPVASNDTASGRFQNRRIEFKLRR